MLLIELIFAVVIGSQVYGLSSANDTDDLLPMSDDEQAQFDYDMQRDMDRRDTPMDRHPVNHPIGTMPANANYYHN